MLQGMATDPMDPATAVTWGPFIQAAYEQYVSHPSEVNPAAITNMPAGYTLVRTIQMTDFFGPVQTRVFYGFVAVGGDPKTAVVALRGTAGLDPGLPTVVCGHSLGGALATLLVADVTANTQLKPQAWTFASPRVGDAIFAARYGALSTVSWRIYNQVDVVPYFPIDTSGGYQPVTAGYAINSLAKAHWSLGCAHALNTYLHVLSPAMVPLDPACKPAS